MLSLLSSPGWAASWGLFQTPSGEAVGASPSACTAVMGWAGSRAVTGGGGGVGSPRVGCDLVFWIILSQRMVGASCVHCLLHGHLVR